MLSVCCRELELSSVSEAAEGEGFGLHHPHLNCRAHPLGLLSSPKPPLCLLRHPHLSPSTDLLTETHSTICARDPRRHAASTLGRLSSSKPTFVLLSLKLPFVLGLNLSPLLLLFFIASALSQLRDSSAGDKFASKTHTSTRQGHF